MIAWNSAAAMPGYLAGVRKLDSTGISTFNEI